MPKKLTKTKKTSILKKIKDESKLLPDIIEELGITDMGPGDVRKQLVDEYGQEVVQGALQAARQNRIPPIIKNIKRILDNKGNKLTEEYCDKLIDELADAIEVVYLKKEELADK